MSPAPPMSLYGLIGKPVDRAAARQSHGPPGSDADLIVWDPSLEREITMDLLHHEGDYSPWEGWRVRGWPVLTVLRGEVVVENGELLAQPGSGRFVRRKFQPEALAGPAF